MLPRLPLPAGPAPLHAQFLAELRIRGFEGDVAPGFADRTVLSTDNSIYQLWPEAALFPRGTADLVRIARVAAEPRFAAIRVAPRGGGTGTNGQSLTDGIAVDVSRHMNAVLEINAAEGWVRVQAGVVKDQLNAALLPHGLFFPPELSTSSRATIGGMVSTDACGQGSCLYGKTRDHVLALTTVLTDGTVWTSEKLDDAALAAVMARPDRVGAIHALLDGIVREHGDAIERQFPKLNRCLTGYDLAHIRDAEGRFDLNAVLCGSEGTLGLLAEAKLNVLPIPRHAALVNIRYGSFDAALRDAQALKQFAPASIETVDSRVLGLAQDDIVWEEVRAFLPKDDGENARGINLLEVVGDSLDAVDGQLHRIEAALGAPSAAGTRRGYTVARTEHDIAAIWQMRKKSVGLLGNTPGDRRPIAFVEDTAVPPEHLADFIAEFRAALDARGLQYGMFGHVDAGVLHVRPAIDLKDPAQEPLIRAVTEDVVALTQKYGGLLWGEHGKGVRSEFSPRFFGSLYPLLQQVKAAFDPRNQLNPGKIAAPEGAVLLRIDGVPLRGGLDRTIPKAARDAFDESMHCNGNGACFSWDPDEPMCPSYKVTRDRRHSPKGRASLVREWLRRLAAAGYDSAGAAPALRAASGWRAWPARLRATLGGGDDFSHAVKDAMDGCLACKSCVGQCPIKVNIPDTRAKFLELYHSRYLRRPRDHLVSGVERMIPLLARMAGPHNAVVASPPGRAMLRALGLVATPKLSRLPMARLLAARGVAVATPAALRGLDEAARARSVVLVPDAFTRYYEAPLLLDFVDLLLRLGFRPWLAPFRANGKPLHVHGFLGRFERTARANAGVLTALMATGVPLVGLDPSMTLTYRAEYRTALGADAPTVALPQEFLARHLDALPRAAGPARFRLLPHCTERTTAVASVHDWQRVFDACGLELEVLQAGCCGMAGTYGHEAEHRATSEAIYGMSWAGHVGADSDALATGYSCRAQAALVDGVRLRHPVQALLAHLRACEENATALQNS